MTSDGHLLLVRRGRPPGQGLWSVPGGRVELGESLAVATERELREETGLQGRCGPVLGWVEHIGPDHHFVIVDHLVAVEGRCPAPTAGDDASAAAWFPLDALPQAPLVPGLLAFLREHRVVPGPDSGPEDTRR